MRILNGTSKDKRNSGEQSFYFYCKALQKFLFTDYYSADLSTTAGFQYLQTCNKYSIFDDLSKTWFVPRMVQRIKLKVPYAFFMQILFCDLLNWKFWKEALHNRNAKKLTNYADDVVREKLLLLLDIKVITLFFELDGHAQCFVFVIRKAKFAFKCTHNFSTQLTSTMGFLIIIMQYLQ